MVARRGTSIPRMSERRARIVAGALVVVVAAAAVGLWWFPDVGSRLRQTGTYARADPSCVLGETACTATFDDGVRVKLQVDPPGMPTETPLTFQVQVEPPGSTPQAVELQGIDMNMGLLRVPLDERGVGTGVVPVCTTEQMRWRADVVLDDRTAGFGFRTVRDAPPAVEPTYPSFTLQSASGPLGLDDLRGQVVAVYFGYTSCPDYCPTTLRTLASARALLPEDQQDRVTALMVSLDPERDSPEHLARYTSWFDPAFRGVTGEPDRLSEIAGAWGVAWRRVEQPDSQLGYSLDHDTRAFLVAPDGHMVGFVRHGTSPEAVARQMSSLL